MPLLIICMEMFSWPQFCLFDSYIAHDLIPPTVQYQDVQVVDVDQVLTSFIQSLDLLKWNIDYFCTHGRCVDELESQLSKHGSLGKLYFYHTHLSAVSHIIFPTQVFWSSKHLLRVLPKVLRRLINGSICISLHPWLYSAPKCLVSLPFFNLQFYYKVNNTYRIKKTLLW